MTLTPDQAAAREDADRTMRVIPWVVGAAIIVLVGIVALWAWLVLR